MAWATFSEGKKFCVYQLDADNNKKGESLECFDTRPLAQNYVKGLYAKEKGTLPSGATVHDVIATIERQMVKAGARHSTNDNSLIQKAHDALCELGAACKEQPRGGPFENTDKLSIFKQADGRYRWITFSSSAFRDRDREIVSTKALENDVARADADGKYGPLRFWHVPGLDIGTADFNAMEGRVLVESGTFADERIGESLKNYADELGVSIGFIHPPEEPDKDGTYHHIRRFERSLVPLDKASNLLTQFVVKESNTMEEEKENLLVKLIGQKLASKFIGRAQESQKTADEAGLTFKSIGVEPNPGDTYDTAEGFAVKSPSTLDPEAKYYAVKVTNRPADKDEYRLKADGDKPEDEKPTALSEDSVKALINKAFAEYDAKQSASKAEADAATTKATSDIAVSLKAIADGHEAIATTQIELKEAVKMALSGVAELKGELPRKLTDPREFYRPSQDGPQPGGNLQESIAQMLQSQKDFQGEADPFAKFTNSIFNQSQPQQFVAPNAPKGN